MMLRNVKLMMEPFIISRLTDDRLFIFLLLFLFPFFLSPFFYHSSQRLQDTDYSQWFVDLRNHKSSTAGCRSRLRAPLALRKKNRNY